MAKPTPKQLEEELKKQNRDFGDFDDIDPDDYGKDVDDDLKAVIGNEPDPEEDGFSIAEEVDKDEDSIKDGSDNQTEVTSLQEIDEEDL